MTIDVEYNILESALGRPFGYDSKANAWLTGPKEANQTLQESILSFAYKVESFQINK
jgi:hypothetical protein